jgi:hypothetical protein
VRLKDMPDMDGNSILRIKSAAIVELPVTLVVVDHKEDGQLVAVNRTA